MAKTTYLLGAGASYNSLPIVGQFEEEIAAVILKIQGYSHYFEYLNSELIFTEVKESLDVIECDLKNLLIGCGEHRSVDTYVKRLFLTIKTEDDQKKYRIAKCSIILFFELYRFFYNKTDKRYDGFLATILEKNKNGGFNLPPDINILSWNYDYEFERAYMKYIPYRNNINEVYDDLNIIHKNSKEERAIAYNFGIIKINGTAGFFHQNKIILGLGSSDLCYKVGVTQNGLHFEDMNNIYPLLKNYIDFTYNKVSEYEPAISFAWEDGEGMEKVKEQIKRALLNTRKLIIIGYSFPYFNREMDKYIMEQIAEKNPKVYIQDLPDRVNHLKGNIFELNQFRYTDRVADFLTQTDLTQFYMSF